MVVATRAYLPPERDPHRNATGLSRKTIEQELEASLSRLGMETVGVYQIHHWDYDIPIEEALRVLDDAVRQDNVRYIGAFSIWAYQFAEAFQKSRALNLERFQTTQNHCNLLYCEEGREMIPLCQQKGLGSIS